jgi:hypothetical protein
LTITPISISNMFEPARVPGRQLQAVFDETLLAV